MEGELEGAHCLLLQYVAGEEEEGCEDEDYAGGDGDGDLAA